MVSLLEHIIYKANARQLCHKTIKDDRKNSADGYEEGVARSVA